MYILRTLAFLFLAQALLAQQPTPILPDPKLTLFNDESHMKIKTAGPATITPGGKVKSVYEAKAEFKIEFEDGSTATFCLGDPGSSIAVRQKNNTVEYLG